MKKKNLTKLMSLTLALAAALTLTACGGSGGSDAGSGSSAGTGSVSASVSEEQTAEEAGTTLSQYLSGGESVWYLVNGSVSSVGKDTEVEQIFLLSPDGTAWGGEADGLTLGDLAQMEEAQIADLARDAQRETALRGYIGGYSLYDMLNPGRLTRGEVLVGMLFDNLDFFGIALESAAGGLSVDEMMNEYCIYLQMDTSGLPQELDALFQTCIDQVVSYCEFLQTNPVDMDYSFLVGSLISADRDLVAESLYSEDPAVLERTYQLYDEFTASMDAITAYAESYEPAPGQYQLSLNTDRTGNAAESVTFAVAVPLISGETEITSFTYRATDGEAQTVYDVSYGGVNVDGGAFLTQLEGSYDFTLEQPGTSDLPVDVEPKELFS